MLYRLVDRQSVPHVFLSAHNRKTTLDWARAHLDLFTVPTNATVSAAELVATALQVEPVRHAIARLDARARAALQRFAADPQATLPHRFSSPMQTDDAEILDLLLFGGPAPPDGGMPARAAHPACDDGSLLAAVVSRLRSSAFGRQVVAVLAHGGVPAGLAADPTSLRTKWAVLDRLLNWFTSRLGIAVDQRDGLSATMLLAGLLDLSPLDELLLAAWPEDCAEALDALGRLAAGTEMVPGLPKRPATEVLVSGQATPTARSSTQALGPTQAASRKDVAIAYLAILGRRAEANILQAQSDASLADVMASLLRSAEFRERVLVPLAAGGEASHSLLETTDRLHLRDWLDGQRLSGSATMFETTPQVIVGEFAPLHPAVLLERVLANPEVAVLLEQATALWPADLWPAARARLAAWATDEAQAVWGAIEHATGAAITGWALDPLRPSDSLPLHILCNGVPVATGRADRPRAEPPAEAPQADRCGFRLSWDGCGLASGPKILRLYSPRHGRAVGTPFRLHPLLEDPRTALRSITAELEGLRTTLARIESILPQLESFAAFAPDQYAAFRQQHVVASPLSAAPQPIQAQMRPDRGGQPTMDIAILIDIDGEETSPALLRLTLASLADQGWPHWRLRIVAASAATMTVARLAAASDPRISLAPGPRSRHNADELELLADVPGELVLLGAPGMELDPTALAWFAHAAVRWPEAVGFYSDQDSITRQGLQPLQRSYPVLRACFDRVALATRNPAGTLVCARRTALARAAPSVDADNRIQRRWAWWAALAAQGPVLHIPRVLVSLPESLASASTLVAPPAAAIPATHPDAGPKPRLGIVIPTRDGGSMLGDCIDSLRATAEDPALLDILVVDNGSTDPATLTWLQDAVAAGHCNVLRADEPFNWAKLSNAGAAQLDSDLFLFLNDDTLALSLHWDAALRRHLADPGIGAVGALLAFADCTIQHGGVTFGMNALVAHEGVGVALRDLTPDSRWKGAHTVAGVTGAFLACRAVDHCRVGRFDAVNFPVTFNDVDFCLRLREAGLLIICDCDIRFLHLESKTRGYDDATPERRDRAAFETARLVEVWGDAVTFDPGYNPHWNRNGNPFTAIREPSSAEIERHMVACGHSSPWRVRRRKLSASGTAI